MSEELLAGGELTYRRNDGTGLADTALDVDEGGEESTTWRIWCGGRGGGAAAAAGAAGWPSPGAAGWPSPRAASPRANTNDLILMIDSGWSSMYLLISALSRLFCSSRKRSATESKQAAAWFCETRRFLAGCEEAWEPDIVAVASGRAPQAFSSQSPLGLWPVRDLCMKKPLLTNGIPVSYQGVAQVLVRRLVLVWKRLRLAAGLHSGPKPLAKQLGAHWPKPLAEPKWMRKVAFLGCGQGMYC